MILVALALGVINLCGFKLTVILSLNFIITFFIPRSGYKETPKGAKRMVYAGKNEFLKILVNY